MERKTRIARKKHGEVTLVPVLREDLQDRYMLLIDLRDRSKTLGEALHDGPNDPINHKNLMLAQRDEMEAGYKFWIDVRNSYDNWTDPLGIRDGFEVVIARVSRNMVSDILGG